MATSPNEVEWKIPWWDYCYLFTTVFWSVNKKVRQALSGDFIDPEAKVFFTVRIIVRKCGVADSSLPYEWRNRLVRETFMYSRCKLECNRRLSDFSGSLCDNGNSHIISAVSLPPLTFFL